MRLFWTMALSAVLITTLSAQVTSASPDARIPLSLQDAIAMALQHNLDIDLQRLGPKFAETDILRASAGGLLRGIPLTVREGPRGGGGPTGQVQGLSALTATTPISGASNDANLSITGTFPLTTGPLPPSLDPAITGELSWRHTTQPQTISFLAGVPAVVSDNTVGNAGFSLGFLTGGRLDATFNNTRQTTNNLRLDYNPYLTSNLGVTFTQPLLRGFGRDLNSRYIRIARNNGKAADLIFRQQVIGTVTNVVQLYWDLVALREDLTNRQRTLDASEELLRNNQSQLKEGVIAPVEVARAQAEVARSRRDLSAARTLVEQQANVMQDYLTGGKGDEGRMEGAEIVPTDSIQVDATEAIQPLQDLMEEAMKNRPDLAQARLQIANSELSTEGSRNALKPQVDLFLTTQSNALAGDPSSLPLSSGASTFILPRSPNGAFLGGYSDALAQLFRRNYPDYGGGIRVNIPLRNRSARADYERDQLEVRRQEIRFSQLEKDIRVDIKNALVAMRQAREAIDAAREERKAQEQVLVAERERLQVGVTNGITVVQYQRDLAQAQSAEVTALAAYSKAKASLDRALGRTLQTNNIDISDAFAGKAQGRSR